VNFPEFPKQRSLAGGDSGHCLAEVLPWSKNPGAVGTFRQQIPSQGKNPDLLELPEKKGNDMSGGVWRLTKGLGLHRENLNLVRFLPKDGS